jgi:hypothetical protein
MSASQPHRRRAPALLVHPLDGFDRLARRLGGGDAVRDLLGGKGANLAEMRSLGLPVPPGFAVTTAACRAFLAGGARSNGRPARSSAIRADHCCCRAARARAPRCPG